jgi:hypothetical protein
MALKHLAALKINVEDAGTKIEDESFISLTEVPNQRLMLKELHDQLLELRPEGASHDESSCPFCNPDLETSEAHGTEDLKGGSVMTHTEEEYTNLLTQVAELEAKVTELEGDRRESQVEAKIAEAKAELEAQVADLQAKLDTAVNEAETVKKERDEIVAFLDEAKAMEEEAAALEQTKADRIAKVKEVANFSDEYIAQRAESWAKLDEDAFELVLADWAAIAKKESGRVPASTAMIASRTDTKPESERDVLREVLNLRFQGIDTRTV